MLERIEVPNGPWFVEITHRDIETVVANIYHRIHGGYSLIAANYNGSDLRAVANAFHRAADRMDAIANKSES